MSVVVGVGGVGGVVAFGGAGCGCFGGGFVVGVGLLGVEMWVSLGEALGVFV